MGLTEEQKQHFIENGWLKIEGAFTADQAAPLMTDIQERLGVWASEFALKAWEAICELSGGEDRMDPEGCFWSNGFIVNLGDAAYEGKETPLEDLDVFHVDGQFFVYYLDSTDQAILCVPLWTDVLPGGGPMVLCLGSVATIAKWFDPRFDDTYGSYFGWANEVAWANGCFDLAIGKVGDVFLLYPFLIHSTICNKKRLFRAIINSKTSLKEPYRLYRTDGNYSVLEQSIRHGLMKKNVTENDLMNWHITAPREGFKPGLINRKVPTKADVTPVSHLGSMAVM
ncbi:hypothetical protein FSHL1_009731 [Fusarium sambucinum]